jgi:uncharacterized membrane protein (UPF0182 family)
VIAAYANQRAGRQRASVDAEHPVGRGPAGQPGRLTDLATTATRAADLLRREQPDYSIVGKASRARDVELDLPVEGGEQSDSTSDVRRQGRRRCRQLLPQAAVRVKFGEPNFLLSERVNENSKVLYDRNPRERCRRSRRG